MPKNKVLIPLNKSELSRKIFPHLVRYISADENELILFYITRPPRGLGFAKPDPGSGYALRPGGEPVGPKPHPIYATQQEDSTKAHIEVELLSVTNYLKELGYDLSLLVDFGDDALEEILRIVTTQNIDLVAMSARAPVGVTLFFFDDIANQIAEKAKIPVLIVYPDVE
jgi:nucleotide-binding universal stress UspA family protein